MKPLLYLDIDGVLNVYGYGGRDYDECALKIGPSTCIVPPYIKPNMDKLRAAYEIVWCTAWLGRAHSEWKRLLDLPEQPYEYVSYLDMKLPEVLKHARGRRWAYLDDEAGWEVASILGLLPRGGYGRRPPVRPLEENDFVWPDGRVFWCDPKIGLDTKITNELLDFACEV